MMFNYKERVKTWMDDKGGRLHKDARVVEDEEEAAILEQMRQRTERRRQESINRGFDMIGRNYSRRRTWIKRLERQGAGWRRWVCWRSALRRRTWRWLT